MCRCCCRTYLPRRNIYFAEKFLNSIELIYWLIDGSDIVPQCVRDKLMHYGSHWHARQKKILNWIIEGGISLPNSRHCDTRISPLPFSSSISIQFHRQITRLSAYMYENNSLVWQITFSSFLIISHCLQFYFYFFPIIPLSSTLHYIPGKQWY